VAAHPDTTLECTTTCAVLKEDNGMDTGYEPPVLEEIGSLHELTLQDKTYGSTDGFTFQGVPITNNS
jgi:hypothetical protein